MSYSNRKKKKILKSNILEESNESINNQNEFSLFNIDNINLIYNSNFDEEKEILKKDKFKVQKENIQNNNNYKFLFKCILSPNECHSMPLLILDSNKNIIKSQCPANGFSNELTNPHKPNDIIETPINEYLKKISILHQLLKCSNCSKKYYQNNNNNLNEIK